jgi:hypothetical protein
MSITKTFSAVGVTQELRIKKGQSLLYRFDALASWDGTVILRKTTDGGHTYTTIATFTDTDNNGATLTAEEDANYSFQCTVFTAGTAAVTMTDMSLDVVDGPAVGTPSVITCTAEEVGDGHLNKTVLRLTSVPVTVISVTTGAGVGGTELYGFPEGEINMLGCIADLSCVIAADDQADFTDATPAGDIAVGTLAPANADGLGTDSTDDDFATAVALTMAAYSSSSQLVSDPASIMDGSSTAKNLFVNLLIDAADIDDGTTSTVYVSGVVVVTWLNLGDV